MAELLPNKIPVVALTQQEIDEAREMIEQGRLPRDWFDQYEKAAEQNVFGHDVKHDRHGNPIEQGVGSAAQPSRNSIDAYRAHQMGNKFGPEKDFEETVKRMEADLAEHLANRAAKRGKRKAH